jgi:hypothetical protein
MVIAILSAERAGRDAAADCVVAVAVAAADVVAVAAAVVVVDDDYDDAHIVVDVAVAAAAGQELTTKFQPPAAVSVDVTTNSEPHIPSLVVLPPHVVVAPSRQGA